MIKSNTQMGKVFRHMMKYGYLTRNEAIGIYRITRLAAVIQRIEARGFPIIAEHIPDGDYKYTLRQDVRYKLLELAYNRAA